MLAFLGKAEMSTVNKHGEFERLLDIKVLNIYYFFNAKTNIVPNVFPLAMKVIFLEG